MSSNDTAQSSGTRLSGLQEAYDACMARHQVHLAERQKWADEGDEDSEAACLADALEAGECAAAIKHLMEIANVKGT